MPFPPGMWLVEQAQKYGEMFTVNLGTKRIVFLNSSRVVEDLMEKRAAIYSSRPDRPMLSDIMSGGHRIVMMGYTDKWRAQRKIMLNILNTTQAEAKFVPFQELEAKQLVYEVLQNPQEFHRAGQRFSNSVILSVIFGRRAVPNDELLQFILGYTPVLGEVQMDPQKSPADNFSTLANLPKPLQWWRLFGERFYQDHIKAFNKEYTNFLDKYRRGMVKPCYAVDLLESSKENKMTDEEILYTFTSLIEAGSDTTRVSILQIMAAAACYPAWVKTAQAALEEVYGSDPHSLPSLHDRRKLPYISAVVKEVLRWRPFLQMGVPHTLIQDDEYEGYKFPKGTEFTWNAYAITLSEKEYSDPFTFEPQHFLNDDLNKPTKGH